MMAAQFTSPMDKTMTVKRLMIADDVPQVRADLRTILGLAEGIEVVGEAENGVEAVIQAARLQPDVILMDLEMPLMDGFEATRLIKKQSPACRVIALTVHGYKEAQEKACRAGIDSFIVKGVPLLSLVHEILKQE
jgi:DNA-binding NarL/FixJ family response regulator